jgi:hypothetical protein
MLESSSFDEDGDPSYVADEESSAEEVDAKPVVNSQKTTLVRNAAEASGSQVTMVKKRSVKDKTSGSKKPNGGRTTTGIHQVVEQKPQVGVEPIADTGARDDTSSSPDRARARKKRNPKGTLYDAVAGRLGAEGFLADKNRGLKPLRPEEVLYSRAGAPVRYEEDDEYFQDRHLPETSRLPESDLLKAIHAYASDFYGSGHLQNTDRDFGSLDETALLAMGILMEETARHALGESGELAFLDEADDEDY